MSIPPPLGRRAIISYRRLHLEIDALRSIINFRKPPGAMGEDAIKGLNSIHQRINKLFCRHASLPHFQDLTQTTLSQADFILFVVRLSDSLRQFEEFHADQLADWDDCDDFDDDLPSPHI
jgi:hypothetical protein